MVVTSLKNPVHDYETIKLVRTTFLNRCAPLSNWCSSFMILKHIENTNSTLQNDLNAVQDCKGCAVFPTKFEKKD